ncbi:MAG TPA: hypothetical protein V6D17_15145 [Candidatus Obscuribacterales bacterium]
MAAYFLEGDDSIPPLPQEFSESPISIIAQARRNTPLTKDERARLEVYTGSWRQVFAKHGIVFSGIQEKYAGPVRHVICTMKFSVTPSRYPAALHLVLDAIYEIADEALHADWNIVASEVVLTRLEINADERSCIPGERAVVQRVKGYPHPGEGY